MEETTIDTIEVNGSDVDVRITWEVEECECTSDCGDTEVTERWIEAFPLLAEQITTTTNGIEIVQHAYGFEEDPTRDFDLAIVKAIDNEVITY